MEHTYINIITLIRLLKRRAWKYIFSAIIGAAVGCFIAFNIPKQYATEVKFSPSTGKQRGGFLDDISDLIGDKNYGAYEDAIYPEIYFDVIKSDTFINSLLRVPVTKGGSAGNISFREYLKEHQKLPFWSKPRVMLQKPTIQEDAIACISCDIDKLTGLLSVKVTTQDAFVSAQIADTISMRLQTLITDYQLSKIRRDLDYLNVLVERTKQDYLNAVAAHARFTDENYEAEDPRVISEQEALEQDASIKYNIHEIIVEQQLEYQSKLKHEEPIFTRIQSAVAYERPIGKSKIVPIIIGMILAVFVHAILIMAINKKKIFVNDQK